MNPNRMSFSSKARLFVVAIVLVNSVVAFAQQSQLWGTTSLGGRDGNGTIFRIGCGGLNHTVVYEFPNAGVNGSHPQGSLVLHSNGKLYGTTHDGGAYNRGVIFEIDPVTGVYTKKVDFDGASMGGWPDGSMVEGPDGTLFGVTPSFGGGFGVFYEFQPSSSGYGVRRVFLGSGGEIPVGTPILASNGKLYGMTNRTSSSPGALYEYDRATGVITKKVDISLFSPTGVYPWIGQNPESSLMQAANGKLYGLVGQAGILGALFEYDINRGEALPLYHFPSNGSQGAGFFAHLIQTRDGMLYGMSSNGGADVTGNLFDFNTTTNQVTFRANFQGSGSAYPRGSLIEDENGKMYGVSRYGGNGNGTIFEFNPADNRISRLMDFNGANGAEPNFVQLVKVKINQVITLAPLAPRTYGDAAFDLQATSTVGAVTYSSSDPTIASTSGSTLTIHKAGTTFINATNAGSCLYNFASATQTLTVNKAPLTSTADNQARTYGEANAAFTLTYSGFVNSETAGVLDTPPVVNTTANSESNAGDYDLVPSSGSDDNYVFTYVSGTLTIGKALLTVTADNLTKTVYTENPELTFSYSGFVNDETESVLDTPPTISTTADVNSDAGTYPITLSGGEDINYAFDLVNGTLTVACNQQTFYADEDGDGYGNPCSSVLSCQQPEGFVQNNFDCDDQNAGIPIAWFRDADGDGFGIKTTSSLLVLFPDNFGCVVEMPSVLPGFAILSCTQPDPALYGNFVNNTQDCNDSDNTLNKKTWVYPDSDRDGFGDLKKGVSLESVAKPPDPKSPQGCMVPAGYVLNGLDCDDGRPTVHECIVKPTVAASAITFSQVYATQLTLDLQRGDGQRVLIVVSPNAPPDFVPQHDRIYNPGETAGNGLVVVTGNLSSVLVTGLAPNTRHYFTAFEFNQVGTQTRYLVDGAPVSSQQTLPLPNVFVTSPANGAAGKPISLSVTARALTGATTYEIELNDQPDFSGTSFVMSGSRTQNFTGLSYAMTYYSRVRTDLSPDYGAVTSFSTLVPDTRVTSPAHGSIDKATSLNITSRTLAGATIYTIELSETSDFSGEVISMSGASTQTFTGLRHNQQYFTRVLTDIYPVYGAITSFRTGIPAVYVTSPVNGDVNKNVSLSVTARAVTGAATYTIELSTTADFSVPGIEQTGARIQTFSGLAYETTYYTRVKTDLSPVYGKTTSFTTGSASSFAFVTSPANGAVNIATSPSITSGEVYGASQYTIQLSTTPDFGTVEFEVTGATRILVFSGLAYSTTYHSRVITDLSPSPGLIRSFTTKPAPLSFVASPANAAVEVNISPTLSVRANAVTGATLYTIQLSTTPDFSGTPLEGSSATTTVVFDDLQYNTLYYTRVRTDLTPAWGAVRSFTTLNPVLKSYVTNPANGSVNVMWVVNITSHNVPGASVYTIEANTASDFTGTAITRAGTPTQSFTLSQDQLYHVRVKTDLSPEWGPSSSFQTGNAVSLAYVTSPVDGGAGVPTAVSVRANLLTGATSYTIELNTNEMFTGDSQIKTSTSRTITFSGLLEGTTYYTRVQTSLAPSMWGPVKSFSTISSGARFSGDWRGDDVGDEEILEVEPLNVVVFENPFADKLTLLVESPSVEDAVITLTDMTGRNVHQSMEKTNSVVDIYPSASAGILLLHVRTSTGVKVTKVLKIE
jgi:uncharacterized repeat protein (TIGR03803 family)